MFPDDKDVTFEPNLLGESSFKVFWAGAGLKKLMWMVDKTPEMLQLVKIKNDKGKEYTVMEFLEEIQKMQVRTN
tara:strand:+ start:602 stop:823 length:222 start_codon:yes stop_codon:yes gene_type:complete